MAKKKIQAAEIIITTTDGGSFKVTGAQARKLAKEMGGLGGAAQGTDRRIKGVTQQSSNATKNFSKQAQTMQGGIVAVYATIAAQVFAVSAAFQFMKSSFETRNLIEGQKAFGSITGVAYKTLTTQIQAATDNMLEFKEAASSVAIGVAAGLAGGQLERLASAAKNASLALGRDLTDSFNRLIRGVTKAEPELLDELGIILRLENATRNYALEVGKARDDLNAYERTQAVLNDVLDQAESKYGRISEIMDPDSFALGQLTKEFDDIIMTFQEFLVKALLPLISFFKENASALVAAMALFVLPIINKLLPDLDKSMIRSKENMGIAMGGMKEAASDANNEFRGIFAASKDVDKARTTSSTGLKELDPKMQFKGGKDQLSARQISAYKRHMKAKTGIYKKFNVTERAAFKRHLALQEATLRKSGKIQVGIVQRMESTKQLAIKTTEVVFKAAEAAKLKAAAMAASAMNKLMAFMGVVGMIMMVVAAVVQLFNWMRNLDDAAKKAREETERLTGVMEGLDEELSRMSDVRAQGMLGLIDGIEQTSNALKSYDVKGKLGDINAEMDKFAGSAEEWAKSDFGKAAVAAASQLEKLAPEMDGYADAIANLDRDALKQHKNKWYEVAVGIINASEALKRYQENQKAIDKQVEKTIGRMSKLPFQDILNPLGSAINDFEMALGRLNDRRDEMADVVTSKAGGAFIDRGAVNQTRTTRISNQGGATYGQKYKFDEKKARQNAESILDFMRTKGVDAAGQKARLDTQSGRTAAFESFGFAEGGMLQRGDLDQTSAFKTEEELINAIMLAQGIGTQGSTGTDTGTKAGMTNLGKLLDFGKGDDAEMAEAAKDLKEAEFTIRAMEDSNENNLMLQEKMLGIQKQSLQLDADKIANQTKLAKMGIGTSKELKQAKNLYKLEQQQEKQKKAGIDAEIAATNKLLETSKLQQQIDNFAEDNALALGDLTVDRASIQLLIQKRDDFAAGKTKTDLTEMEKLIVTNLENQIRAVTNSEIAVTNMDAQVVLQGELTTNAAATKTWADKLLDIQERQLEVAFKKLGLQRTLNELKRKEADITLFGYAKARQAFAGKGASITARKTQNTTDINAAIFGLEQAGIDPNAEGFDPTVPMTAATKQTTGAAAGTGLVQVDKANEFLKQFNTQTEAGVNLTAEWNNYIAERGVFATNLLATENELLQSQREQVLTLNPAQEIYNEKLLAHIKAYGTEVGFNKDEVAALAVEQASVNIELELMSGIQDTLKNGFMSMFQSLIDGSKSFKDSMKDLAKSVLADLAAMYLKAAALKFMLAFMPGGDAVMATLKGTRYGGIQTGYAGGGIAAGPNSGYLAKLHGTEAVVPLGNDRAIPVDLKGAGGNVVNVAVNISGQGASTQSTGAGDAAALGRSIGGLVQQHLQTEMRPGGLLNRQGATGRGG